MSNSPKQQRWTQTNDHFHLQLFIEPLEERTLLSGVAGLFAVIDFSDPVNIPMGTGVEEPSTIGVFGKSEFSGSNEYPIIIEEFGTTFKSVEAESADSGLKGPRGDKVIKPSDRVEMPIKFAAEPPISTPILAVALDADKSQTADDADEDAHQAPVTIADQSEPNSNLPMSSLDSVSSTNEVGPSVLPDPLNENLFKQVSSNLATVSADPAVSQKESFVEPLAELDIASVTSDESEVALPFGADTPLITGIEFERVEPANSIAWVFETVQDEEDASQLDFDMAVLEIDYRPQSEKLEERESFIKSQDIGNREWRYVVGYRT